MPLKGYIVLLDEFLYKIGFDVDSGKIKQIDQAKEYQDSLQESKTAMQSITTQVALKLIPVVNQSLKGFNNFLKANKALVVEGLTNVFKWVLKLGQVFTNTFRFLNKVISRDRKSTRLNSSH